jgi:hypothetical protein
MNKLKPPQQRTWQIFHIRGTPAQYLGMVEARDEGAAILKATEELKVPPQERKRLNGRAPQVANCPSARTRNPIPTPLGHRR